jgi:hypothetical protein
VIIMKKLLILILAILIIPALAFAQLKSFGWDASTGKNVVEYRLYQRPDTGVYDYKAPVWIGPGLTCTIDMPTDGIYALVVRAVSDAGVQSGNSNELTLDMTAPPPPGSLREIKVLNVENMNVQNMNISK